MKIKPRLTNTPSQPEYEIDTVYVAWLPKSDKVLFEEDLFGGSSPAGIWIGSLSAFMSSSSAYDKVVIPIPLSIAFSLNWINREEFLNNCMGFTDAELAALSLVRNVELTEVTNG